MQLMWGLIIWLIIACIIAPIIGRWIGHVDKARGLGARRHRHHAERDDDDGAGDDGAGSHCGDGWRTFDGRSNSAPFLINRTISALTEQ